MKESETVVVEENPTMDQPITTTTTVSEAAIQLPVKGALEMKWNRRQDMQNVLAWTAEGSEWDLAKALYVYGSFESTRAAVEAIANYVGGSIWGTPTFLGVAPAELLMDDLATGVFAHVSSEHDPDQSIQVEISGQKLDLYVKPSQIPPGPGTWRSLRLVKGKLVADPNDPIASAEGQFGGWVDKARNYAAKIGTINQSAEDEAASTFPWWYAEVASTILQGKNVGVTVNKFTVDNVNKVLKVAQAADPRAENEARKTSNRSESNFNRRVEAGVREEVVTHFAQGGNGRPEPKAGDFLLAVYNSDRMFDMSQWPIGMPIYLVDENGFRGVAKFPKDAAAIRSLVQQARQDGKTIDLS